MGQKSKGGMWCDYCCVPVAGQKATHRTRGAVVALTTLPTGGLSLLGAKSDGYHCGACGQPVRRMTRNDVPRPRLGSDATTTSPDYLAPSALHPTELRLLDPGPKPIAVIREIRGATGLDLAAAHRLVTTSPSRIVLDAVAAEALAAALREVGAEVTRADPIGAESAATPAADEQETLAALERLGALRASGALSEAEFSKLKARVLEGDAA